MAKPNPVLTIWVWTGWWGHPEIHALALAGHRVCEMPDDGVGMMVQPVDLILHPAAHAWSDAMFNTPYLKAALTAARKRSRERKKANG